MKSLTMSDIADLCIDRQRACLARKHLTEEDRLAELSSSAIAEAKEACDNFISFAFEIESLLAEKAKNENKVGNAGIKQAWVLSMRADIETAQQRLRTAISHLTISVDRVREYCGSVVEF